MLAIVCVIVSLSLFIVSSVCLALYLFTRPFVYLSVYLPT